MTGHTFADQLGTEMVAHWRASSAPSGRMLHHHVALQHFRSGRAGRRATTSTTTSPITTTSTRTTGAGA